jgi:Domain of unknown function (DUF4160)
VVHRGRTVLAMDCVLAGAETRRGRPLNSVVRCQTEGGKTEFYQDRAPSQGSNQLYCGPPVVALLRPPKADSMPTVPDIPGPYRFFFYSFDCQEPPHVHVRRERMVCKFWLTPVVLSANDGFSPRELNRIRAIILDNLNRILEAWHEHCGE